MVVEIEPWAMALVLLIVCNVFFSFNKRKIFSRLFMIISSLLAIAGLIGSLVLRSILVENLAKRTHLEWEFTSSVLSKYDIFARSSGIFVAITVLFLLFLLVVNRDKYTDGFKAGITLFNVAAIFVLFTAFIIYSFSTINKRFDTASYIGLLTIYECFILYIPLIAKRLIPSSKQHNI